MKSYALHQGEFTPAQISIRDTAAVVTSAWQSLDQEHRCQWEAFSREHLLPSWTGSPKRISAYNWFMKLNWNSYRFFDGPYSSPPTDLPAYVLESPIGVFSDPSISISWSPQSLDPVNTWCLSFWIEGPYLHQRIPSIKRAKLTDLVLQENSPWLLTPPSSGWYGIHVFSIAHCGTSIQQSTFMIEVP